MRKTISEMAKISGVSVRTLHYYDEIGLLKPAEIISQTGYRYYGEGDMEKLQQILFYRELEFSLKEIKQIMESTDYNRQEALKKQKELLMLKRKRLDDLIRLLETNLKGEKTMDFEAFDTTEIEKMKKEYAQEAKERWGNTDAYAQSQNRTAGYEKEEWQQVIHKMDELLKKFAEHLGDQPESPEIQELVRQWQQHITENYYDCTKEILSGLGQMYIADKRFTKNMDKFAPGTTNLISEAIKIYCKEK